ncbi:MAG: hypothetical protein ACRDTH_24420 [Pseudonocardiaceae bacterium]
MAPVLLGLAAAGRAADAMPLGVLGSVLTAPAAGAKAALAFGGLFGADQQRPGKPAEELIGDVTVPVRVIPVGAGWWSAEMR